MENLNLQNEYPYFEFRKSPTFTSVTHMHNNYEIYYLKSGYRRYFIGYNIYDLGPGDIILIPPMVMHRVTAVPNKENKIHERYLLSIPKSEINDAFLKSFNSYRYNLTDKQSEAIFALLEKIRLENESTDSFTKPICTLHTNEILSIICRANPCGETSPLTNNNLAENISKYIQENFDKNITLKSVAEHFSYRKEYFSVLFKQLNGLGFNQYLTQVRLTQSLKLLVETDKSITEISAECGWNNSNYFSSVFKKELEVSPLTYRKKYK